MRMGMQAVHQLALAATIITMLFACSVLHVRAATAATYYVATTGNDANPGTQAQPFQTISKGLSLLHAGDTLYLRGGTYREGINHSRQTIPSGTSWTNAITIAAYSNETVTLQPGSGTVIDLNYGSGGTLRYVIFDGININGSNSGEGIFIFGTGVDHLRFQNLEVKNAGGQGVNGYDSSFIEFINLHVHNNGTTATYDHGFYIAMPSSLIENCDIHDNRAYGVQNYHSGAGTDASSNTVIRNNRIHNNPYAGVTLNHGDNIQFYNNIVSNNGGNGIDISYDVLNTKVYNNTIYGNSGAGISLLSGSNGAVLRNNIIYQNGSAISDSGVGTVVSNNLMIDPKFVDPSTVNFHLQSTSPAIDAGVALSTVQTDLEGTPRPQGTSTDIGAYEYRSGQVPSPTSQVPSPTRLRTLSVLP